LEVGPRSSLIILRQVYQKVPHAWGLFLFSLDTILMLLSIDKMLFLCYCKGVLSHEVAMKRTILGLLAFTLPLIGAPMGVKAEENATVPQSAASTVATPTAPAVRRLSTREVVAGLRADRMRLEAARQQSGPPPVLPVTQVVVQQPVNPAVAVPLTPFQKGGGESSLFGGNNTTLRGEAEYSSTPSQTNSKAGVTVAPKGKPFLSQVTGYNSSGTCPADGGTCSYDSTKLDFYGALRGWSAKTEWNAGLFVRLQDNKSNGTWRSPDGLYSGVWKADKDQTDFGLRLAFRRQLDPKSSANPWIGGGGEYDFVNGGFDLFGEGGIRPGNSKNPWNLYTKLGLNSDGGYFYPEITTPNLIGPAKSKVLVQLRAKGVLYGLGRDNSTSRLELGAPITLNLSPNTAIQVTPAYVLGLDSNTRSGFGATVMLRFGL
jgi:hypothetical protein